VFMSQVTFSQDPNSQMYSKGWIAGIGAFLFSFVIAGAVIWYVEKIRIDHLRDVIRNITQENANQLRSSIGEKLALAYPLAAMIEQDGTVNNFESIAEKFITFYPDISEIALAPDGVITQVVPFSENEKAIGFNLLTDSKQKTEALLARKDKKLTLAGPLNLVQGGVGLVGRLPVFTEEGFWGFILIVIRFPDVVNTTLLNSLDKQRYHYTLSRIHPNSNTEQILAASAERSLVEPIEQGIDIPNAKWTLRIAPAHGWYDRWLLLIEIGLGMLISILLGYIVKQYFQLRNYRNFLEVVVHKRTAEVTETKNFLLTLLDTIPDMIWLKDREGIYMICNPMFERFFGAKEEEIVGKNDYDFVDKELADSFRENDRLVMEGKTKRINEEWVELADEGRSVFLETTKVPMLDGHGDLIGVLGIAHDITAKHNNLQSIQQLSQMYAALSQCNHAIIHAKTSDELFSSICASAVTQGGLEMAWIGLIDSKSKNIYPVASYGDTNNYLEGMNISMQADTPFGKGPTGTAARENRPFWCQDYMNDSATLPWREHAELIEWKASAALPIHLYDEVIGVFTLYSSHADHFDPLAQELLTKMTMDISFAMENFDREAKRRASQESLLNTEKLLEQMSDMAHVGGWEFDTRSGEGTWTAEVSRIHDMDPSEVTSRTIGLSVYEGVWREKIEAAINEAINDAKPYDLELPMRTLKGNEKWIRTIGVPIVENDEVIRIRGSMQDITVQKTAEEKALWLANFDALTGLPNGNLLNDRVTYLLNVAERNSEPLAVMFLDLDNFKNINDSLGHTIGNQVLVEVASRIKKALREEDTVSRLGGDEFIMLFPKTGSNAAMHIATKLITEISKPSTFEHNELTITPSIGISIYPNDGEDFETLLKNADTAMYKVKNSSRNGFQFFTQEMQLNLARNLRLENALRHALERNELQVYYQPQISIEDGSIIGAEALLRWRHPDLGMISLAEFIPIAESSGQIIAIGEWVLRTAIEQAKAWMESGLTPIVVAVNLSAIQFRQANLLAVVTDILQEVQLPNEYLELELTEAVTMHDPESVIKVMNTFHEQGIRMSIDDFGTGYSSLSYLKKFKVYKLKIDQSFIHDISADSDDRAIVSAIIDMAQNLGLKTIAEGVETAEQLDFLRLHGCEEVQGYYFSKPLSSVEFERFQHDHAQQ
jgi:diguanylate cyclase (GGDEF)-like protein/PAS domain S-box-containing protein